MNSNEEHYQHMLKTGKWGRCGVGAIILDRTTDELILSHRSEEVLEPFTYGTIGGAIDYNENKIMALRREINEELGLENIQFKFKHLYTHKSYNFSYHNYLAISDKSIKEKNCVFNWENIGIVKKSLKDWLESDNLHPGVSELFSQKNALSTINNEIQKKTTFFK